MKVLATLALILATSTAFLAPAPLARSLIIRDGLWDSFKDLMEARDTAASPTERGRAHECFACLGFAQGNYAGEDSPYARAKADDEKKKAASRAKIEARKAKGFTELADTLRESDARKNAAAAKAARAPPPKAKAPAKAPPSILPDFKPPQLPKIKAPWDK